MDEIEDFIGCMINHDLTNITLNISQPNIINKTNQGFKEDVKSLMNFNTPAIPHKGIVRNKETYTKLSDDHIRDTGGA